MTFALGRLRRYGGGWVVAGWLVLLTGCATPRIDWQARVGHYTYDQAILELGPPEKSATLTDGSVVADWLTQRGQTILVSGAGSYLPYPSAGVGMGGGNLTAINTPDYLLRLRFDPAHQLIAWKKVQR